MILFAGSYWLLCVFGNWNRKINMNGKKSKGGQWGYLKMLKGSCSTLNLKNLNKDAKKSLKDAKKNYKKKLKWREQNKDAKLTI